MTKVLLKIGDEVIGEIESSTFHAMRGGVEFPNPNYSGTSKTSEGFGMEKFIKQFEERQKEIERMENSMDLTLRINPIQFEFTNVNYTKHYDYFQNKAKEMLLFYLLNPEE